MRFRTKVEIERYLSAQRTSGLSITAYCKQENISQNTFFNWRKRFPDQQLNAPTVPFLKLPFSVPAPERLDLTLPNGAKISAPLLFEVPILRNVVRMLAPLRPRR